MLKREGLSLCVRAAVLPPLARLPSRWLAPLSRTSSSGGRASYAGEAEEGGLVRRDLRIIPTFPYAVILHLSRSTEQKWPLT